MESKTKYNILIVDDNPLPTKECCRVLIEKFCEFYEISDFDKKNKIDELDQLYEGDYTDPNFKFIEGNDPRRKDPKTFDFGSKITLTIYNYDPKKQIQKNQEAILKIINDKQINIFWTDKGYLDFEIDNGKVYDLPDDLNSNKSDAIKLYHNESIISVLKTNKIRQIAIYFFNPAIMHRKTDELKKFICDRLNNSLSVDNVYVLETSPILNLYNRDDWLSSGKEEDCFLGTLNAYKCYGTLLGSVLFDLFTQLPEHKKQDHHNFFDSNSRDFLRHFKTINNLLFPTEFKIGLVSFYGKMFGIERFIIDAPYKEYYEIYDKQLETGDPPIGSLIQIDENVELNDSERWFYIKYKKTNCKKFIYKYELSDKLETKKNLIGDYLPLLHTAIFYEPDFYPEGVFKTPDVFLCNNMSCEYSIEILYLLKKVNYGGFDGVTHLAVWRRCDGISPALSERKTIKDTIESIWEKHYRLIEPELKATLVSVLQEETKKQALSVAIAEIFARNFAHNIGSHVAIRATDKMVKQRVLELYNMDEGFLKQDCFIHWLDYMGEKFDLFEVARNEFVADTNLSPKNLMFYRHVLLPFVENTLIMDNIAHSEGINYKIDKCYNKLKIKTIINGNEVKAKYSQLLKHNDSNGICYSDNFPYLVKTITGVSLEDAFKQSKLKQGEDLEICLGSEHTIYSILENMIRNSAKHNKERLQGKEFLEITVNVKDEEDPDYYTIQIFDNISAVTADALREFQKKIDTSLINEKGEIEKANLGIADIKINAHLLKTESDITDESLKKAITLIYRLEYEANNPITKTVQNQETEGNENIKTGFYEPLEAKVVKETKFETYDNSKSLNKEKRIYNFGYEFKLSKPKKVIWIGKKENSDEYRKKGVVFVENHKDFKPEKLIQQVEPLANYQFAILELEAVKDLTNNSPNYDWDDFLIKLPHRVLLNATEDQINGCAAIKELVDDGRIQLVEFTKIPDIDNDWDFKFLKQLWEEWLKAKWGICSSKKAKLVVYFEEEQFAEKWNDANIDGGQVFDLIVLTNTNLGNEKLNNVSNTDVFVIYDHHAKGWIGSLVGNKYNGIFPGKLQQNNLQFCPDFINKDAYFQFDKSSDDYVKFAFPDTGNNQFLFVYEAIEAGLMKIVIVDERITEMLSNYDSDDNIKGKITKDFEFNASSNQNYTDLANNGNVFIVTEFANEEIVKKEEYKNLSIILSDKDFNCRFPNGVIIKENNTEIKGEIECQKVNFDSLIIHRTYLAKLFDNNKNLSKKELMNLIYKTFKSVVVISGGGYPHSFEPLKVKFKPYSQLKKHFIKYPSKVSLTKII
ncbi:MAG: hypothetical protein M0Q41_02085 [Bacteroidales bacterium]|nr:hypothetical protein [Acholeplasmataceae bacterium]MCK9447746.1 hypothetical protein [Bacteroidales bacterium]